MIIIESSDLDKFNVVYDFKNNNDFYKYKTEIYIHDGTYVVFATNVIDNDKNFIAVSIDGEKMGKSRRIFTLF